MVLFYMNVVVNHDKHNRQVVHLIIYQIMKLLDFF